jgi:hypothetical protein
LATLAWDNTVRFWNLTTDRELSALQLLNGRLRPEWSWDFDFHCDTDKGNAKHCWIAVPLVTAGLALYDLGTPYD